MTPGYGKPRSELPWLPYESLDRVIINAHNFGGSYDSDAAAYIAAVEAADGASLGTKYKDAINDFVVGAKADGFWTALKSACFLAGPATLGGALVPLVGTAPTNVGGFFVSGDYNQSTGLIGDGSTKYLNSNRTNNADPQDDFHLAVWISTPPVSGITTLIGAGNAATAGESNITWIFSSNSISFRNRNVTADGSTGAGSTGLIGSSRSSAVNYITRLAGVSSTRTRDSQPAFSGDIFVFSRIAGASKTTARIAFYSIGESLDLALLDARLTTYMAAIA